MRNTHSCLYPFIHLSGLYICITLHWNQIHCLDHQIQTQLDWMLLCLNRSGIALKDMNTDAHYGCTHYFIRCSIDSREIHICANLKNSLKVIVTVIFLQQMRSSKTNSSRQPNMHLMSWAGMMVPGDYVSAKGSGSEVGVCTDIAWAHELTLMSQRRQWQWWWSRQ